MTQATDIHTDPNCSRTMDPDRPCGSSLGPIDILSLMEGLVTQVGMIVALTLDLYVTFGGNAEPELQHRPQPR